MIAAGGARKQALRRDITAKPALPPVNQSGQAWVREAGLGLALQLDTPPYSAGIVAGRSGAEADMNVVTGER
jgi:hypothetical protein